MTQKKEYPQKIPFINREKETEYLLDYLKNVPKNILFVYGPKSTGKTTLMRRVIKQVDQSKFHISFYNLREILITSFRDFEETFFPSSLKEKLSNFLFRSEISVAGFKWEGDEKPAIKENVFGAMIRKMQKLREEGITPVIIIDEFQYLRGIRLFKDEEILLIEELFKFFIALTKQNNLAHVICMTSDSYYMEELYNDTKLTNTSKFYHIKHLSKEDVRYWLTEKGDCSNEMFEEIWENLGGSAWEIWMVFVAYKNGQDWKAEMQDLIQNKFGVLNDYYKWELKDEFENDFIEITKSLSQEGKCITSKKTNFELIKIFVDRDIWFYDAKFGIITPNSKSQQMAMKMLIDQVEKV
jgi:AAA+ ATPase superfamily predicted ATPase